MNLKAVGLVLLICLGVLLFGLLPVFNSTSIDNMEENNSSNTEQTPTVERRETPQNKSTNISYSQVSLVSGYNSLIPVSDKNIPVGVTRKRISGSVVQNVLIETYYQEQGFTRELAITHLSDERSSRSQVVKWSSGNAHTVQYRDGRKVSEEFYGSDRGYKLIRTSGTRQYLYTDVKSGKELLYSGFVYQALESIEVDSIKQSVDKNHIVVTGSSNPETIGKSQLEKQMYFSQIYDVKLSAVFGPTYLQKLKVVARGKVGRGSETAIYTYSVSKLSKNKKILEPNWVKTVQNTRPDISTFFRSTDNTLVMRHNFGVTINRGAVIRVTDKNTSASGRFTSEFNSGETLWVSLSDDGVKLSQSPSSSTVELNPPIQVEIVTNSGVVYSQTVYKS